VTSASGDLDPWDAGVQNERTALAWQRTGLALFGATIVAARLGMRHWPVATVLALAPSLLLSVVMMRLASVRYRRAQAALHNQRHGPGGRLPFVAASAVTLLGLAALAAVLAGH
jgi:putative membrane protein